MTTRFYSLRSRCLRTPFPSATALGAPRSAPARRCRTTGLTTCVLVGTTRACWVVRRPVFFKSWETSRLGSETQLAQMNPYRNFLENGGRLLSNRYWNAEAGIYHDWVDVDDNARALLLYVA